MIRRPFSRTSHLPCSRLTMASLPVATMALMASITPWGITVPLSSFIRRFSRRCLFHPTIPLQERPQNHSWYQQPCGIISKGGQRMKKAVWKSLFSGTDYNKYYILYQVVSAKHNSILQLNRYQNGLLTIVAMFERSDICQSTNIARQSGTSSCLFLPIIE